MSSEVRIDMEPVARAIARLEHRIDILNSSVLGLGIALGALQTAVVAEIGDLKSTIVKVEKQKLHAKTSTANDLLGSIDEDLKEFEERLVAEMDKLRNEYFSAIDKVVGHLKEEIEVNVEPLHEVLSQLDNVTNETVNPTLSVCSDLKAAYTSVYESRLHSLEETTQRIVKNFEDFIRSRENLVQQIESMQVSGVPVRENASIHIPFWFVGVVDSSGNENVVVLPILEKFAAPLVASAKQPYVEHLKPAGEFAFEELAKELASEGNIELARGMSPSVTPDKESLRRILDKMRLDGLIHESFVEAIDKFREVY